MAKADWHPGGLDTFFKSDYTYDDANLLAGLWNIPVDEAKQVLGHKILNGIENLLPDKIQRHDEGHYWLTENFRAYANSDYDYDDAELLASLWDMTLLDAKNEIGYKVKHKLEDNLPEKLREDDKIDKHIDSSNVALNAFDKSDYSFADAELLAQLWNISILEAKKTIGFKINEGIEKFLPDDVRNHTAASNNALTSFDKSCYSYDDAELLAQLWGISTFEAKKTIGFKVIDGLEHLLPDKLGKGSLC